jgi:uncharacterized BrkB/YihY/UPF0761 family membrane protein
MPYGYLRHIVHLFFSALHKYSDDSGAIYAAAIAYAALAAVFPLLLILFVLLSPLVQPSRDIGHLITRFLDFPGLGDSLSRNITAVFFALAVFAIVLLALLLALAFGLRSLRDSPIGATLPLPYGPSLLAVVAPPFITLTLFFLGYKFLPNARVATRAALAGALAVMVLAEVSFAALTWYLDSIADYGQLYKQAGAVFALLAWLYALATVFLLGAEVSATVGTSTISKG